MHVAVCYCQWNLTPNWYLAQLLLWTDVDNGTDCDSIGSGPGLAIPNFHSWKASKNSQEAEVVQMVPYAQVLLGKFKMTMPWITCVITISNFLNQLTHAFDFLS